MNFRNFALEPSASHQYEDYTCIDSMKAAYRFAVETASMEREVDLFITPGDTIAKAGSMLISLDYVLTIMIGDNDLERMNEELDSKETARKAHISHPEAAEDG